MFFAFAGAIPALADCEAQIGQLKGLLNAGDMVRAASVLDEIKADGACDRYQVRSARKDVASALLKAAAGIENAPERQADYASLVRRAAAQDVFYVASWRLGDIEREARDYTAAARAYQQAVELLGEEVTDRLGRKAAVEDLVARGRDLVKRADEARLLAAMAAQPQFAAVPTNHRGALGGAYNPLFSTTTERGIAVEKVATPITFQYDSADFTPVGVQAAQELAALLTERRPGRASVVGHTDRKGSDAYNDRLSLRRAQEVVAFLKTKGIEATLVAEGKGKREPRQLSDPAAYSQAEIDELNRRVEVTWDQ